jgi:hypothetical protein
MAFMITPQALAAWTAGDRHACHEALGIMPWDHSPFDVRRETPPDWLVAMARGTDLVADVDNWRRAYALRQALILEAGPPGRFDQHGRPLGRQADAYQ